MAIMACKKMRNHSRRWQNRWEKRTSSNAVFQMEFRDSLRLRAFVVIAPINTASFSPSSSEKSSSFDTHSYLNRKMYSIKITNTISWCSTWEKHINLPKIRGNKYLNKRYNKRYFFNLIYHIHRFWKHSYQRSDAFFTLAECDCNLKQQITLNSHMQSQLDRELWLRWARHMQSH